jgi:Mn-dependent DtxR family transcriptional regulator
MTDHFNDLVGSVRLFRHLCRFTQAGDAFSIGQVWLIMELAARTGPVGLTALAEELGYEPRPVITIGRHLASRAERVAVKSWSQGLETGSRAGRSVSMSLTESSRRVLLQDDDAPAERNVLTALLRLLDAYRDTWRTRHLCLLTGLYEADPSGLRPGDIEPAMGVGRAQFPRIAAQLRERGMITRDGFGPIQLAPACRAFLTDRIAEAIAAARQPGLRRAA